MTITDEDQYESASERLKSLPAPPSEALREQRGRNRRDRFFVILASFAAALGLIGAAVALGSRDEAEGRSNRNAATAGQALAEAGKANQQAQAATDAAKEANRRLAALGKPTVPVPTITTTLPPLPIVEGLTGSQAAAVRSILAAELVRYRPTLTAAEAQSLAITVAPLVKKPADGKTPTAAELRPLVAASLTSYCVGGRCDGKQGVQGPQGATGPAPDAEQLRAIIATQLAAYCAQDGSPCKGADSTVPGPTGPSGPLGPTGERGRGITRVDCQSNGFWLFTYSDGSSDTLEGPCRVVVVPTS